MKPWLHKLESFVDRAIPYTLILLTGIIIVEIFFKEFAEAHALGIEVLDYMIIAFFVADLIFKYNRIRNIKLFFKECWLDIIAVFPFVLFFRIFESLSLFVRLPAEFREGQSIMHTILEGKKEFAEFFGRGSKLVEDAKLAGELSRTEKILKILRPLARSPRLIKALPFYEKPTGKHHLHEMEELDDAEKGIKNAERAVKRDIVKAEKQAKSEIMGAGRFIEGKLNCHPEMPENRLKKAKKK